MLQNFVYCLIVAKLLLRFYVVILLLFLFLKVKHGRCYTLFYKNSFSQLSVSSFSWSELQMLFRCYIKASQCWGTFYIFYIYYICVDLGLLLSYLCDLFFISIFIFNKVNRMISWIRTYMLFCLFFRICPIILGWERGWGWGMSIIFN